MTTRFRATVLALMLLVPATARAQTPDAQTLLRGMARRAGDNVAGVRSYTLAYTAGPTRLLAYAERTPKGTWISSLQPGNPSPVHTMIAGALQIAGIVQTDTLNLSSAGILAVRPDTAGGRLAYAIDIDPSEEEGESPMESMAVLVDAETFDLLRAVTTVRRGGGTTGSEPPVIIWIDMADYRRQSGVRIPGRYHVRGWNMVPAVSQEERAEMLRQMEAQLPAGGAGETADLWMYEVGRRMVETGTMDLSVTVEVVEVNRPPPPQLKPPVEDDGR